MSQPLSLQDELTREDSCVSPIEPLPSPFSGQDPMPKERMDALLQLFQVKIGAALQQGYTDKTLPESAKEVTPDELDAFIASAATNPVASKSPARSQQ